MPHYCAMSANDLVAFALRGNPGLAATTEVWRASDSVRSAALQSMSMHGEITDQVLYAVVSAQLEARADSIAQPMVAQYGIRVADAVFSWATDKKWEVLPSAWLSALESLHEGYVHWLTGILAVDSDGVFTVPRLISPTSSAITRIHDDAWLSCVRQHRNVKLDGYTSGLFLLILHAGMTRKAKVEKLVASAFGPVYRAAHANVLNEQWWKVVEDDFVTRSWWDRCRTLRVGLVSKWVEYRWSTAEFVLALPDSDCFSEILSMWGWDKNEKMFLGNVIQDILSQRVPSSESFVALARQCERWF